MGRVAGRFLVLTLVFTALTSCASTALQRPSPLPPEPILLDKTPEQILAEADYLAHLTVLLRQQEGDGTFYMIATLSGFVIEENGRYYIVTASHIKLPNDEIVRIEAYFHNQTQRPELFELIGYDRRYDTAVLRPRDPNFIFNGRVARFGNYSEVRVGDTAVSLGSPEGVRYQLRTGKVRELRAPIRIQTDDLNYLPYTISAMVHDGRIAPGCSGGPVVNLRGEIMGMNVGGGQTAAGFAGVAIPIEDIQTILSSLIAGTRYD